MITNRNYLTPLDVLSDAYARTTVKCFNTYTLINNSHKYPMKICGLFVDSKNIVWTNTLNSHDGMIQDEL